MKKIQETYISVDIESDGPIPGPNSMLSLGAGAYVGGKLVDTFSVNLETLEGAAGDPNTMVWWAKNPAAWDASRKSIIPPAQGMKEFVYWVEALPGRPVFVGFPATYDFMFVYWYMMKFVGRSPFSHSALDLKTLAMVSMKCEYRDATKRNMPRRWFSSAPHTHIPLDDAIEQGDLFLNVMRSLNMEV